MKHEIFISYSHVDIAVCEAICAALEPESLDCWYAPRDIEPGADWLEAISRAIDSSKLVVLIYSKLANDSTWVISELTKAKSNGLPIIPFCIDDTPLSAKIELLISNRQWLYASNPPTQKQLDKLTRVVQQLLDPETEQLHITTSFTGPPPKLRRPRRGWASRLLYGSLALAVAALGSWGLLEALDGSEESGDRAQVELLDDSPPASILADSSEIGPVVEPKAEEANLPAQPMTGRLDVDSEPQGAEVRIGLRLLGRTPLRDFELVAGDYMIDIDLAGYRGQKRSAKITAGHGSSIQVELREVVGTLAVATTPAGAHLLLDGERSATSPHTYDGLKAGEHELTIRLDGHRNFSETVQVNPLENNKIDAKLELITGQLEARALPSARILIDGDYRTSDTNATYSTSLLPGSYEVVAEHSAWGSWTKQVEIAGDGAVTLLFDFTQEFRIRVTSSPRFGSVYVDGYFTGKYTPCEIMVRPGSRHIEVLKEGYRMLDGGKELNLESQPEEPLEFQLRKIP